VRPGSLLALLTVLALLAGCSGSSTVQVSGAPPDHADRATCRRLLDAVPSHVANQPRRTVHSSWGAAWGDPAIVLSCGSRPPSGFGPASSCTTVDGVDWYLPESEVAKASPGTVNMTVVNRKAYVRVVLPPQYWPPATALADLSPVVRRTVPATTHCH
jgi:hypothetical protein